MQQAFHSCAFKIHYFLIDNCKSVVDGSYLMSGMAVTCLHMLRIHLFNKLIFIITCCDSYYCNCNKLCSDSNCLFFTFYVSFGINLCCLFKNVSFFSLKDIMTSFCFYWLFTDICPNIDVELM